MIRVHQNAACPVALRRRRRCRERRARPAPRPPSPPARPDDPRSDRRTVRRIDRQDEKGQKLAVHHQLHQWAAPVLETAPWTSAHHTTSSHPLTTDIPPTLQMGRLLYNASLLCSISVPARSARLPVALANHHRRRLRLCSCRRICRICRNISTTCRNRSSRLKVGAPPVPAALKKKLVHPVWRSFVARLTNIRQHCSTSSRASSLVRCCPYRCRFHSRHCLCCPTTPHPHRRRTTRLNISSRKADCNFMRHVGS